MGIRSRILWPFTVLFVAAFAAMIAVSVALISGAVERRMADQVATLSRFLSTSGRFALTSEALPRLKEAFDADLAVVRPKDRIVTLTTLTPDQVTEFSRLVRDQAQLFAAGGPVPIRLAGHEYEAARTRLTVQLLAQPESMDFYLLFRGNWTAEEKAKAIRPLLTAALPALAVMILLGYLTARLIASPIVNLVEQARRMASGQLDHVITVPETTGEVAELARALEVMVEGLKKYQSALVQAERLGTMGAMAAGVAHEIRNPLTSLKMTLQMLNKKAAPEDRESFHLLLREIERLELAVSELITASQQVKLNKEHAELSQVADDVLDLLGRQLEHLSVRVEKKYNGPSGVEIDVARFKRAVMNLVLNGAQAMAGGGTLTVATDRSGDGSVRLSIRDGGPGIPEELQAKIFEPFVTARPGGTGLGLSVTRRVVEEHGGRIGFETGPSGTTFWIEVPLCRES